MRKTAIFSAILIACILNFTLKYEAFAKKKYQNSPYKEYLYQQKVLQKVEKEKYERGLLPFSGYMSKDDYEELSRDIPTSEIKVPEAKLPKDIKMKYVPQPTYKLTRYNNPPGSVELNIQRKFKFDRTFNAQGVASPDRKIMVYPVIYYYAKQQCTAGELYVIPLDTSLPDVQRLETANIAKRIPAPILSTSKDLSDEFTFRSMTPVDFSPDSLRLAAKEKVGNSYDGIWQTNLWVYDFETQSARELSEIRDAIKFYWLNTKGESLDDRRWDIYPLGFDSNDPQRIVVSAYGFTGGKAKFLGNWSIDYKGEQSRLISLFDPQAQVGMNGFKLIQDGVVTPDVVKAEEKKADKKVKKKRKAEKKEAKKVKKEKKHVYKQKVKEIKKETKQVKKQYNKLNRGSKPTE